MKTTKEELFHNDFKVWMTVVLGLLKDGKMGASQERADRIKAALAYARPGKLN